MIYLEEISKKFLRCGDPKSRPSAVFYSKDTGAALAINLMKNASYPQKTSIAICFETDREYSKYKLAKKTSIEEIDIQLFQIYRTHHDVYIIKQTLCPSILNFYQHKSLKFMPSIRRMMMILY